jgi:hypothetical protein
MSLMARFQETLRRLAMIDESFVEDEVGLRLELAEKSALDPRTAALRHVGASVTMGVAGGQPGMERCPGAGGGRE